MILAKPVIPDQYWILRQDDRKVGNIEADRGGFLVTLNGERTHCPNLTHLQRRADIRFLADRPRPPPPTPGSVMGWPVAHPAHNVTWNVRLRAPQYTQEPRSRSWLVAGWWCLDPDTARPWMVLSPKIIVLERRPHRGPFLTEAEAHAASA